MTEIFDKYAEGVVTAERVDEHIALVTLNRPDARNAVNAAVTTALDEIVRASEADADIWAVVLTGAGGRVFSAGADLKEVSERGVESLYTDAGGFAGLSQADRTKVWIAAVDGFALAGGFELVLSCDMVVASEGAQFGLPEVGVGLLAAAGGAYRLPRVLPRAVAAEMITTTDRMDAVRAHHFGLVNRLAPADGAVEEALTLARKICTNAPLAVQESLAILRKSPDLDDNALDRLSMEAQDRLQKTEDFKEGPRAFIEKRPPVWKGK